MEILLEKSEMVTFLGQDPLWIANDYDMKRILNILVVNFPEKMKKTFQQKLTKFVQISGILNNTFKLTLVRESLRIKVHNALAVPILLYGREICIPRQTD
jgi:hypothetical protein